jgi:hypothetical protein
MQPSQFVSTPKTIATPNCPKCGSNMWLARIERDKLDHDRRTFECPDCQHVEVQVFKFKQIATLGRSGHSICAYVCEPSDRRTEPSGHFANMAESDRVFTVSPSSFVSRIFSTHNQS